MRQGNSSPLTSCQWISKIYRGLPDLSGLVSIGNESVWAKLLSRNFHGGVFSWVPPSSRRGVTGCVRAQFGAVNFAYSIHEATSICPKLDRFGFLTWVE